MLQFIKSFRAREDGAVTVDWVVLTAAIVGLSIALIAIIAAGATDKSTSVGAFLSSQEVMTH
ncbi:MAG: hypothetical protein ABF254_01025 [Octadecabacter sp.]